MGQITESGEQAHLLIALIDNWLAGLPSAEDATIADRTISDPDKLNDIMAGYVEQRDLLTRFRGRLLQDVHYYDGLERAGST